MMPNQKEQAEVLRYGLQAGVRTVADAVAWADSIIAADPQPDIAVIEVACGGRRPAHEMVSLLRDVAGQCDRVGVIRRAMADLRTALVANPARGPEIASWLYQLATGGELPEEQFGQDPYSLGDWFVLASSGTYGTTADAARALDPYLERHAWRHEV
jgi:hypothetical protein